MKPLDIFMECGPCSLARGFDLADSLEARSRSELGEYLVG